MENKSNDEIISWIEKTFNIVIKNKKAVLKSLIHPSYSNEHYIKYTNSNQRLEFLGDAIVDLMVSNYLYDKYKNENEGYLTTARAELVSKKALAIYANEINLGYYLLLGKGEISTNGRTKDSNLADAFESIIASIYKDSGFDAVEFVFNNKIYPIIEEHLEEIRHVNTDYKTKLQEFAQLNNNELVYKLDLVTGPDHDREFTYSVIYDGKILGTGIGRKKKIAQNNAAKEALKKLVI